LGALTKNILLAETKLALFKSCKSLAKTILEDIGGPMAYEYGKKYYNSYGVIVLEKF
jgi:hypothetical protein